MEPKPILELYNELGIPLTNSHTKSHNGSWQEMRYSHFFFSYSKTLIDPTRGNKWGKWKIRLYKYQLWENILNRQSGKLCSSLECHFQVLTVKKSSQCSFCRFSLRNSFSVLKVHTAMSKRMDKRSHTWYVIWPRGKLMCAVCLIFFIHLLFAAANYFRSLAGQLTPITNKTLKVAGEGSASRLVISNIFYEGWEERVLKKRPRGNRCGAPKGIRMV